MFVWALSFLSVLFRFPTLLRIMECPCLVVNTPVVFLPHSFYKYAVDSPSLGGTCFHLYFWSLSYFSVTANAFIYFFKVLEVMIKIAKQKMLPRRITKILSDMGKLHIESLMCNDCCGVMLRSIVHGC